MSPVDAARPATARSRRASSPPAPRVAVLSTLFPHAGAPSAGVFIRERMLRVARHLPVAVIAPRAYFPVQDLLRRARPHFRPDAPAEHRSGGLLVRRPRFFSVPGALKRLDGLFLAAGCAALCRRWHEEGRIDVIDAHFAYPEGDAARRLARRLGVPYTVTLRGTEARLVRRAWARRRIVAALEGAAHVFAVSDSLRALALDLGIDPAKVTVVPNGVDTTRFFPGGRDEARRRLGLDPRAPVLVSAGGLVERKGFHRVIDCLPALRLRFDGLVFLVAGGPGPEGDWSRRLAEQVDRLGLGPSVRFLGPLPPDELRRAFVAADVFVLATRNEGWANVFLEAMACGLPVVTTDVGGNREVVARAELGTIVPFGDEAALGAALADALGRAWDRRAIVDYAAAHTWDDAARALVARFGAIAPRGTTGERRGGVRGQG